MPRAGDVDYSGLSVSERILLVEEIWDSIADAAPPLAVTPAQRAEYDRRWAAYLAGDTPAAPWEEVRERLPGR